MPQLPQQSAEAKISDIGNKMQKINSNTKELERKLEELKNTSATDGTNEDAKDLSKKINNNAREISNLILERNKLQKSIKPGGRPKRNVPRKKSTRKKKTKKKNKITKKNSI